MECQSHEIPFWPNIKSGTLKGGYVKKDTEKINQKSNAEIHATNIEPEPLLWLINITRGIFHKSWETTGFHEMVSSFGDRFEYIRMCGEPRIR